MRRTRSALVVAGLTVSTVVLVGSPASAGVNVTLDGVANDGEPGEADNVCSTSGRSRAARTTTASAPPRPGSYGASGDDTLTGGPGADHLDGVLGYVDVCNNDGFDIEVNCEA